MWKFVVAFCMDGAIILIIYLLFIRLLFAGLLTTLQLIKLHNILDVDF